MEQKDKRDQKNPKQKTNDDQEYNRTDFGKIVLKQSF